MLRKPGDSLSFSMHQCITTSRNGPWKNPCAHCPSQLADMTSLFAIVYIACMCTQSLPLCGVTLSRRAIISYFAWRLMNYCSNWGLNAVSSVMRPCATIPFDNTCFTVYFADFGFICDALRRGYYAKALRSFWQSRKINNFAWIHFSDMIFIMDKLKHRRFCPRFFFLSGVEGIFVNGWIPDHIEY